MNEPLPAHKRRRLVEACIAVMVLCVICVALLGQPHRPIALSGTVPGSLPGILLAHDARAR